MFTQAIARLPRHDRSEEQILLLLDALLRSSALLKQVTCPGPLSAPAPPQACSTLRHSTVSFEPRGDVSPAFCMREQVGVAVCF